MADGSLPAEPTPHGRCPICRKPGDAKYRPFCSKRCADVDLARWLGGTYAIAGKPVDDEDGDGGEHPQPSSTGKHDDADA